VKYADDTYAIIPAGNMRWMVIGDDDTGEMSSSWSSGKNLLNSKTDSANSGEID